MTDNYHIWLCGEELPDLPPSLTIKSGGRTKTTELLSGDIISFLKTPGLEEISLSLRFPTFGATKNAQYYSDLFKRFRKDKKPTQFILIRYTPDGKPLDSVNIKVSIGEMSETETADAPFEKQISLSLLEYVTYGTQTVKIKTTIINGVTQVIATIKNERDASTAPQAQTYTVKEGDTLWSIAAKYLGTSAQYKSIFEANSSKVSNPNLLQPGTVLTIPKK